MSKLKTISFILLLSAALFSACSNVQNETVWPPVLPASNEKGVASLSTPDLLTMPSEVRHILDSARHITLSVATEAPLVELVYHNELPNAALNGVGWSSWGDICLASNGKVYSGTGNHWYTDKGETYVYSWDPSAKEIKKIADVNKLTAAADDEIHFSKVHAPIFEGRDKKIYFTGTLDDGDKGGSKPILDKWSTNIPGGKLFQYDPASGKTIVYADFPPARVTATSVYDPNRNFLYCELEGDPRGVSFGVFDMGKKEWVFQTEPGVVSHHRNLMLDKSGNVYFNGVQDTLSVSEYQAHQEKQKGKTTSMLPADQIDRIRRLPLTEIWKYDPETGTVSPTKSKTLGGFRASTHESKSGFIYGTTMAGELFRYSPSADELTLLGSNFLDKGEYITVCVLSPDEKYMYYLPGAHGSAGFSGTPVIQYDITSGKQKALAFLSGPMSNAFNYSPGGTYGVKISKDGSTLYIGLNGSVAGSAKPKQHEAGFGLTSFAIVHIPAKERAGK
ncbi:hypothetical protein [Daejeonella sp. JGW-45]|uniref:hypothetical protein n=1 Tax=Daejeonella sp. JGW-45 TaxID=3034148 RepID=UPI0023EE131B|nr:hypothetical protein [Daejeonella sp. JGW-45]